MLRKARVRVVECLMCRFFFSVIVRVEYVKAGYVVCCHKHTLGRMWSQDFAGKREFRLLLRYAEGLEFGGIHASAEVHIEIFSRSDKIK
jgi:hypothetical protein